MREDLIERLRDAAADAAAEGKVRPPSRIEKLLVIASGHDDKAQTHAARRVLDKRGIDWRAAHYAEQETIND